MRRIECPTEGRSRSTRVYRLWIREDTVPHEGQGAVGDVVRRVRVISSATSTPSTSTSGRSGKMIMECLWVLEKTRQKRKNVQSLSIPHGGSARLRKIQVMVFPTLPFEPLLSQTTTHLHKNPQATDLQITDGGS